MESIQIEKIFVNEKDKNGKPFISKKGQPFKKVTIQANEKWYSCFQGQWNSGWKVGDTIEVEVEEKEFNGNTYYNIKAPNKGGFGGNTQAIEGLLGSIDAKLSRLIELAQKKTADPSEDIPF